MGSVSIHDNVKDELKEECEDELYNQKMVVTKLVQKFCEGEIDIEFQ